MSYAIIVLELASLVVLVVTAFLGYALGGELAGLVPGASDPGGLVAAAVGATFRRHFALALLGTLAALFAESMIFFYFIGTGVAIKKAVALYDLDRRYLQQVRAFKARTSGVAFLALLALIAAFVLGGGAATRAVPRLGHEIAAWVAIALHGWSAWASTRAIRENVGLLAELDQVVRAKAERGEVAIERTVV